jgi:hypothetical protein
LYLCKKVSKENSCTVCHVLDRINRLCWNTQQTMNCMFIFKTRLSPFFALVVFNNWNFWWDNVSMFHNFLMSSILFQCDQTVWDKLKPFQFFVLLGNQFMSTPSVQVDQSFHSNATGKHLYFLTHPDTRASRPTLGIQKELQTWCKIWSDGQNPSNPVGWIYRSKLFPEWLSNHWTKKSVSGDHIFQLEQSCSFFAVLQFCFHLWFFSMSVFCNFSDVCVSTYRVSVVICITFVPCVLRLLYPLLLPLSYLGI